ncbi:hypothetical protein EON66_09010 [archaeon]|nr:MAG: hypothetical protein EON66_09010 [archaeon]
MALCPPWKPQRRFPIFTHSLQVPRKGAYQASIASSVGDFAAVVYDVAKARARPEQFRTVVNANGITSQEEIPSPWRVADVNQVRLPACLAYLYIA